MRKHPLTFPILLLAWQCATYFIHRPLHLAILDALASIVLCALFYSVAEMRCAMKYGALLDGLSTVLRKEIDQAAAQIVKDFTNDKAQ